NGVRAGGRCDPTTTVWRNSHTIVAMWGHPAIGRFERRFGRIRVDVAAEAARTGLQERYLAATRRNESCPRSSTGPR
ncbi:MAG: hypothetical protein V1694_08245, partial [Candidatus Eisenbacteria bacterium]